MSCLGVHFALPQNEIDKLRAFPDDTSRLDYLKEEIEESYFTDHPELVVESDKAWDAMHRVLTGGELTWNEIDYPLSHVILGGADLYSEPDYIMSLKTPKQVQDIATALPSMLEPEFRERYFAIDAESYGLPLSEEDFLYTWEYFQAVREFFLRISGQNHYVLFTADQ
jgi:Domain of unknown function (DUF1877)